MEKFLKKYFDTAMVWLLYWGIFVLVLILVGHVVSAGQTIGFLIGGFSGFFISHFTSKYVFSKFPRYIVILTTIVLWLFNIYFGLLIK